MDIKEPTNQFLSHCKYEKNLSAFTLRCYEIDLRQFKEFVDQSEEYSIEEVNKIFIRDYVKSINHLKAMTVKRKVATLKAFFRFLEFDDIISESPFRKINISIKTPKRIPVSLTLKEVKQLFDHLEKTKREMLLENNQLYSCLVRDIAIFELMFASGMRIREVCAIKFSDVDFEERTIKVWGKWSRERLIFIPSDETWIKICEYYQLFRNQIHQSEYFLISQEERNINPQTIRHRIIKHTKDAGITKNVTPHTFRHTYATLLLEQDVDLRHIQHFLGHSTIRTTQMYTQVNSHKQREILRNKHPRKLIGN